MENKLKLDQLRIKSYITENSISKPETLKGGSGTIALAVVVFAKGYEVIDNIRMKNLENKTWHLDDAPSPEGPAVSPEG